MPITGQLSSRSDADFYRVDLSGSGSLQLNFDSPSDSQWAKFFRLDLIDASGTVLQRRETGADLAWSVDVGGAGAYFVKVSSEGYRLQDGDYRLTLGAKLDDPIPAQAIVGSRLGDRLSGTAGDDLIYGLGGNDLINGADGSDTVVFRASSASLAIHSILGLSSVRGNYAAGDHAHSVSRLWAVEQLRTLDGDLSLQVLAVEPLLGTLQADRITGSALGDLIDGLGGSDFIDGGEGADTVVLFGPRNQFAVLTIEGITQVQSLGTSDEYAGSTSKLIHVESLAFSQDQTLTLPQSSLQKVFGSSGADLLAGSAADEVFDGQGGRDTIDGGAGRDTLVVFARMDEFDITLPTLELPQLTLFGKMGSSQAGQRVTARHIEHIAFADQGMTVAMPAGLIVRSSGQFLAEGGAGIELWVSLASAPTADVTVNLLSGDQLLSDAASLTLSVDNWQTPQKVVLTAIDDSVAELQHSATLTLQSLSEDVRYAALADKTLSLSITDNDAPALGRIGGQLWGDLDKDGQIDAGEQPLSGWRVWIDSDSNGLWSATESQVLSDSAGRYWLSDLPAGTYTVAVTPTSGWAPTYPSLSTSASTVLSNQGADQALTIGPMTSAPMTLQQAQATYQGLGLATGIASFRTDVRFADLQGQGQAVVILDTGIDPDHPAFGADANGDGVADRIVYQYDFVGSNDALALDGEGHGTHVAGIIGSADSQYGGIAPQADLIVLKVLDDQGSGNGYDIQEAMNWVVANASRYNIAAVNLSLGDGSFYTTAASGYLSSQIQALTNSGVMVVAAAGNGYGTNSRQGVAYPAADPYALAVGAVWAGTGQWGSSQTGSTDAIAFFSQRDDTESDIFAPGVSIQSAQAGGGYVAESGTSMAAPEVTGMITLAQQLAQRELGRRLSFDELRTLLKSTGDTINDGDDERDQVANTGLNFKRIDMLALAEAIVSMRPAISHTVTLGAGEEVDGRHFGFAPTVTVQALAADDMVVGTQFGEVLKGGAGADRIEAGEGDDELFGEDGDDELSGGAGSDRFIFNPSGDGQDTITDLSSDDRIEVPGIQWQAASDGDGEQVGAGQIQVQVVNGSTLLSMGTDEAPGADLQLTLPGVFSASQFTSTGSQIGLLAVDSTPPTVQFSDNREDSLNRTTPTVVYTLSFSEPVTGLTTSDFVVDKGQVASVSGSGSSWSVSVNIFDATSGQMKITLKAGAVSDGTGNTNLAASDSSQAIDTLTPAAPTITARGITAPLIDPKVKFDTTLGSFTLELDPDLAPFSANNLLNYTARDFYDGTIFHRIVNDADLSRMQIVQGGGFTPGLIQKTPEAAIPLESSNGLSNVRGTVAMARTSEPNTGTSQFYINVDDNLFLDYESQANPGYAVFGRVVEGMGVLDQILIKPLKTVGNFSGVPATDIVVSQANIVQAPSTVYSRTGLIDVGQLEAGATLYYSIDGGATVAQASTGQITLPVGTYYIGNILTQQVDAAGNMSNPGMYGRNLVVDKTAPQLLSMSPASGATNVGADARIVLTFDEPLRAGSGQIMLKTAAGTTLGTYLPGDPNVSLEGNKLTITPAAGLRAGTAYTVQWTEGAVTDLAGNPLAIRTDLKFTTAGSTQPMFWKTPQLTPSTQQLDAAVTLNDAIAVLKMIVGLPVNSDGSGASAAQAIAADIDQDRQVSLNDAIGILKLIVDLPGAPQPAWTYHQSSTLPATLSSSQAVSHSTWRGAAVQAGTASAEVDLVGVLTGDVDGSWAG